MIESGKRGKREREREREIKREREKEREIVIWCNGPKISKFNVYVLLAFSGYFFYLCNIVIFALNPPANRC